MGKLIFGYKPGGGAPCLGQNQKFFLKLSETGFRYERKNHEK